LEDIYYEIQLEENAIKIFTKKIYRYK